MVGCHNYEIWLYDNINHARVGFEIHNWEWFFQSFILKWPWKLTCVITIDSEIWIVHEFDIGSQDARFEIIASHVVASPCAAQCNMDWSLRDSISDQNTVNVSALLVILTLAISSLIKIIDALYKCNWIDALPSHNWRPVSRQMLGRSGAFASGASYFNWCSRVRDRVSLQRELNSWVAG